MGLAAEPEPWAMLGAIIVPWLRRPSRLLEQRMSQSEVEGRSSAQLRPGRGDPRCTVIPTKKKRPGT
jgi:hypothetical protein